MRVYWSVFIATAAVLGQPAAQPSFEAASVRRNTSASPMMMLQPLLPGGRFNAENVPLRILIQRAYGVQDFQISGGPGWINSDHFDIVAKAGGDLNIERITAMLRSLLEERFTLAVHREMRDLPIYALVTAKGDGRPGAGLHRSDTDCAAFFNRPGPPPAPPAPGEKPTCGMMGTRPGQMLAGGTTMTELATRLSQPLGRLVVDRTGLTGGYDFELDWTPDNLPPGGPTGIDIDGPSIFTAVQEQLGLKLESTKGPVEVLVIDHIEHPSEN